MIMIRQVADAFGVGVFDEAAFKAHLGGVAGAAIGGSIAGEVLNFIPIVRAHFKALKAEVIGEAVIEYFYERSPLTD